MGLSGLGRAEGKKPRDGPRANVYRAKPRMYERVNHRCDNGKGGKTSGPCSGRATKPEAITLSRSTCSTTTTMATLARMPTATKKPRIESCTRPTFRDFGVPFMG